MLLIDRYAYINKLKNYNPQVKILFTCGAILLSRLIDCYLLDIGVTLIMIYLIVGKAKIPFRNYLKLLFIPVLFLITSLITIMVSINSYGYIYYFKIMNTNVGITIESLAKGTKLFTTVLSSLTSVYFLILTTPIIDIIKVLKKLKVPNLFIELMVLIYRSIFIFIEEANNIYLAQTMKFGYENKTNSLKSTALLIRNLFVRVFLKHKEMNISLECKLYDGDFKLGD